MAQSQETLRSGTFKPYQEFLSGEDWIQANVWFDLITKQKAGTISEAEKLILKNGHFKVK